MDDVGKTKMGAVAKSIEMTANIGTICVVIVVIVIFGSRYFTGKGKSAGLKPGEMIQLAQIDWSTHMQNIVLILQSGCHFCSESAPFYQQLLRAAATRKDVRVIAVMPDSEEAARKYLEEHGVEPDVFIRTNLDSLRIEGTPAILLADNHGAVAAVWVGKLTPEKETEVFKTIGLTVSPAMECGDCGGVIVPGK